MMLPYMEQTPIYNAINFNYGGAYNYGAYANMTAWNKVIKSFCCPSDTNCAFQARSHGCEDCLNLDQRGYVSSRERLLWAEHLQLPRLHRNHNVKMGWWASGWRRR